MQIQVTDKEGDIQDTVWVQEVSLSGCNPDASFTQPYQMPSFTPSKDLKATINVNYSYGSTSGAYPLLPGCNMKNDSCYFRFWLKDVAGHVSDTVSSPTIVLQN